MENGMDAAKKKKTATGRKPVQARAEETRMRILTEARKAFSERGFDGSNMRDIAAAAGVSHAMIRYHFGTKDQLWRETVRDMFERQRRELALDDPDMPPLDTLEGLREFLRRYIRYSARNPEHSRIMILESIRGGERLEWAAREFVLPGQIAWFDGMKEHFAEGHLPKVWPVSLAYILTAMCRMPFLMAEQAKALYGIDLQSDAAIEAHTDAVLAFALGDPSRIRSDWPPTPDWLSVI